MEHHLKIILKGTCVTLESQDDFILEEHLLTLKVLSAFLLRCIIEIESSFTRNQNWCIETDTDFLLRLACSILAVLVAICESSFQRQTLDADRIKSLNVLSCGFFWFSSIVSYSTTLLKRFKHNTSLILGSPLSTFADSLWLKVRILWLECFQHSLKVIQYDYTSRSCFVLGLSML